MLSTHRLRPLIGALTLVLLTTAACAPGLPPLIRGPLTEPASPAPVATELPPTAEPQVLATAPVTATTTITGTGVITPTTAITETAMTPTVAVEATAVVTETAVMTETTAPEPTPAITVITGQVVYKQRMALTDDAVVTVVLQDTSRADAPAVTLGSQTIETKGAQQPIPFAVEYDLNQIDPAGLYTMRATITEGGQLSWTSAQVIPVITRGAPTDQIEIEVQPVSAQQARKEMGTLEGTVTYLQRSALPPNAVVEVTLQDVAIADAPAKVLAKQVIETKGAQVPIPFSLEYDPAALNSRGRYSVSARITVDGKLRWISTTMNPVLTDDFPVNNVEIIVQPVKGS